MSVSLDDTRITQAALFALEIALFRLVRAFGLAPDYLIGHSLGELAAAHAAGVLSLQDACRLVAARGELMAALPEGGAMVSIQASEEEALQRLLGLQDAVSLAAVNGPRAIVVSGDRDAVLTLAESWASEGRKTKRLRVSHAFHSPCIDGMLDRFAEVARTIGWGQPTIPIVSNVTGEPLSGEICSPEYWVRHARETVRFGAGLDWLAAQGVRSFLELGPDGVLSAMARECLVRPKEGAPDPQDAILATAVVRSGRAEADTLTNALAELWAHGSSVDFGAMLERAGAKRVALPTYGFQRRRYWLDRAPLAAGEAVRGSEDAEQTLDGWRYRIVWKSTNIESPPELSGRWLVLIPRESAEEEWVAAVMRVVQGNGAQALPVQVDGASVTRAALAGEISAAVGRGEGGSAELEGVLSLLAIDESRHPEHPSLSVGLIGSLVAVQSLGDVGIQAPLWLLSRGAVAIGAADRVESPRQSQVWGLGLSVGLEHSERWGGLVDLPREIDERASGLLAGVLRGAGDEDQLAVRPAGVFCRRLLRAEPAVGEESWRVPAGTVLVTGGTGGLGVHVARWLARNGAEHLLLLSRRGEAAPAAPELRAELAELGVGLTFAACDASDREQLVQAIAAIPAERPLSVVIHAAGAGGYEALGALTSDDLVGTVAPKAHAAEHLDEITADLQLDAFVLFSSIAATFGSGGQGHYAAANAHLDGLAASRRARGLPASVLAWGAWAGDGMAAAVGESELGRHGLAKMEPTLAVQALRQAIDGSEPFQAVADIRWERYAPVFCAARPRPLIEDLAEVREALGASGAAERGERHR